MDRRSLIKRAGIAGVLAAGVAPAVHAAAAKNLLRLSRRCPVASLKCPCTLLAS